MTEEQARKLNHCPNCGRPKQTEIVCWDCFKRIPDPFKYAGIPLQQWLDRQPGVRNHQHVNTENLA